MLLCQRFMGQEASSALASLAYRNSNFFKLTRCQSVKLVQTTQSLIPNSSSLQKLALQDQGLQLDNIIPLLVVCVGRCARVNHQVFEGLLHSVFSHLDRDGNTRG